MSQAIEFNRRVSEITLGAGCFWCTQAVYAQVRGVLHTQAGYCNGHGVRPSYAQVCTGTTGYNEVVQLTFDPVQVSLRELLEVFFVIHDPTSLNRQGHDVGTQYRSGIYFSEPQHEALAQAVMQELQDSADHAHALVTELRALENYWPAEDYHQDYFGKNPNQAYCLAVAAPKVEKFRKTFARLQK